MLQASESHNMEPCVITLCGVVCSLGFFRETELFSDELKVTNS